MSDIPLHTALKKTADLLGADVFDPAGHRIATVKELFIDPLSGQTHFAILEIAALLGAGGKYHPVPFRALRWDTARPGYVAPFDKDKLKAGPAYDRDQLNSEAYGWDTQVIGYYA